MHTGFSFVEAISQCPVNYGHRNGMKNAVEMLNWQKEHAVPIEKWNELEEEEKRDKFPIGLLYHENRIEYTERYREILSRAQGGGL